MTATTATHVVDVGTEVDGPVTVEVRQAGEVIGSITVPARATPDRAPAVAPQTIDERGRELIEIACDVISQKGFAATSMRDIAAAAEVPIATMYRHIGSKDELLYTITATRMQELFDHFEERLTGDGSATDRLAEAVRVYLAYISENHRYINLVYRETKALSEDARARIYDTERRFMDLWQAIIQDGIDEGAFASVDVELAANLSYFACTVWALRHWSIGDRSEGEVAALLTAMILEGLADRHASA